MKLKLYNSLSRSKEPFTPMNEKRVTLYCCGPTVYSYAHIGNARAAVVADVLFRVLRHLYGAEHVVYARNITDVDDKIIASAKETGEDISAITQKYARIYNEDLAALNCLMPSVQPKATEAIDDMIALISTLLDNGFAYISDGHVFFDVAKDADYGRLSGNTLEALRGGDRVGEGEVARKRNAHDFVLWKPELDGVGWDAQFGKDKTLMRGRPGWHIECSAMAKSELGETIDIHCGGIDLKFPHHENEIAQSECASGKTMANFWVHNEFLNMARADGDSDKMSKSLGNIVLVHDLLGDWDGEVIRLALLKAHYRSELLWSETLLQESKAQLDGWYRFIRDTGHGDAHQQDADFAKAMLDDLNVPLAIAAFAQIEKDYRDGPGLPEELGHFKAAAKLLGLLQKDPDEWFRGGLDYDGLVAEYDQVRDAALAAKEAGNKAQMGALFGRADEIRDQFKAEGVIIESGSDGKSRWRKA